jgi:hypothetical protein
MNERSGVDWFSLLMELPKVHISWRMPSSRDEVCEEPYALSLYAFMDGLLHDEGQLPILHYCSRANEQNNSYINYTMQSSFVNVVVHEIRYSRRTFSSIKWIAAY